MLDDSALDKCAMISTLKLTLCTGAVPALFNIAVVIPLVKKSSRDANTPRNYRSINPRRARSALGVDTVLTLDVCLYVCMFVCMLPL